MKALVVKLTGAGTPNSDTIGTGLTATGTVNDSPGRLGGQISILGLPDAPVVLTSFRDDTVGAGLKPDGSPFTDNNGDKTNSRAEPNDWRSIYLAQNSTDRNVDVIPELELSTEVAPGLNGNVENAQLLGELAGSLTASDEVQRLGFEVEGFLSNPDDVDIYSFIGRPGTEVWIDIDKTSFSLDSVIELLDENGTVLARSDDSGEEIANGSVVDVFDPRLEGVTTSLQARDPQYSRFGAGGVFEDFDTDESTRRGDSLYVDRQRRRSQRTQQLFLPRPKCIDQSRRCEWRPYPRWLPLPGSLNGRSRVSWERRSVLGYSICQPRHSRPGAAGNIAASWRSR